MGVKFPKCSSVNLDDSKFCKECAPVAQGIELWTLDQMSLIFLIR
jgi:hypothetical protein